MKLARSCNWCSSSLIRRLRSSSRRCASSNDCRRRTSESRTIISDRRAVASLCSSSATRPRKSSLMTSNSLTRVFSDVLAARRLSYVCGASIWRSTTEEVEPGDGCLSCRAGRVFDWWNPFSPRVTLSNMCCGAMLEL